MAEERVAGANQWRRFNFFEKTPITDPGSAPIYSDNQVLSVGTGKDTLYLGTRTGTVRAVSKSLELLGSWQAHTGPLDFLFVPLVHNVLVTVSDLAGQPTAVSVWSVKSMPPKLISTSSVTNGDNKQQLTAFSCSKDAAVLAFGYADGSVVVLRGDLVHDRGSRQRTVASCSSPVTGVHLYGDLLFVTTLQQVLVTSTTTSRNQKVLEKQGAELNCSAMFGDQLVVARHDEISFYYSDHRGATREFMVPKRSLHVYKHFLVLVTVHKMLETDTYRVVILDTLNDLIPFDGHVAHNIQNVFVQWNQLNIFGCPPASGAVLYMLREKPVPQQLEILKQQILYPIAIKLAENAHADSKVVMSLHQDYGDYLDGKGDSEQALEHYLAAIDLGDTSHVIMRYKDTQKVTSLARYLEELRVRGIASTQHLTLLMVCYTTLRDTLKLRQFVERAPETAPDSIFDYVSAIEICRKSHYYDIAAYIAEKWHDTDLVVQIKLFDLGDYKGCLEYIRTTSVSDALWALVQNSRTLLNELPVETTSVLILLFTGKFIPRTAVLELGGEERDKGAGMQAAAPLLQSYQAFINYITLNKFNDGEVLEKETYEITYQPPRPALIFPSFIGHNNEFVIFLEACLENSGQFQPSKKDLSDILTTLYQVYLSLAKGSEGGEGWNEKAQALIRDHNDLLDANTVLMVTKLSNISLTPAQLIGLGGSYLDVFRDLVDRGDPREALGLLEEVVDKGAGSGEREEVLCLALEKMSSSRSFYEVLRPRLEWFLEKVLKVVSAVEIIEVACKSTFITVGDLKGFLLKQIEREQGEIRANTKIAASYQSDVAEKQEQIASLVRDPQLVQNTSCSLCSLGLELPVVHFGCQHSYHERCLGDTLKCPVCTPELESIQAIRAAEVEVSTRSELFFNRLEGSSDHLRVISDYISKGGLSG